MAAITSMSINRAKAPTSDNKRGMTGRELGKKALRMRADEAAEAEKGFNKVQQRGGVKSATERNTRTSEKLDNNEYGGSSEGVNYKNKVNAMNQTAERLRKK